MQLTSILKTRAAYWANPQEMTNTVGKKQEFGLYYYLQLVDTVRDIVKDIFICIIKEQCSDQGGIKRKG